MKRIQLNSWGEEYENEFILLNIPFDANSRIPGTRLAPHDILTTLESRNDIHFIFFKYYYNVSVLNNRVDLSFFNIEQIVERLLKKNNKIFMIGGDHSLTYPILKTISRYNTQFSLVVLDAHHDSHKSHNIKNWSFIRELSKIIDNIVIIGNREKYNDLPNNISIINTRDMHQLDIKQLEILLDKYILYKDVYLSIDLDVLDPSIFPGVSYPLSGGIDYITLESLISYILSKYNILSLDMVEYNPIIENKISNMVIIQVLQHIDREISCTN